MTLDVDGVIAGKLSVSSVIETAPKSTIGATPFDHIPTTPQAYRDFRLTVSPGADLYCFDAFHESSALWTRLFPVFAGREVIAPHEGPMGASSWHKVSSGALWALDSWYSFNDES